MLFHELSDSELLVQTRGVALKEKAATLELLEHLLEVERRDLAFHEGYGSLWEYVHRGLGYSEGAASERVAAMRLLKRAPQAAAMLREEKLSLSVAAKVQHFVRATEKEAASQVDLPALLTEVAGKSKREVEKLLLAKDPVAALPRESTRERSPTHTELRFVVDAEVMALLEEAKALLGTENNVETLRRALKQVVEEKKKRTRPAASGTAPRSGPSAAKSSNPPSPKTQSSRTIGRKLRQSLWQRAQGRCEYEGRLGRCQSRHRLQIDHKLPLAHGGRTEFSNLRVLCAHHNLAQARAMGLGWWGKKRAG